MKITLLDIKGFGKFNNLNIKPSEGFNIVYEDNEAGKTTLQAFIRAMLYGLKGGRKSRDGSLPPLKQYKPWNGDQYSGILEYRLDDGSGFRIGRNFDKGSAHIYDDRANDITNEFPHCKETGPRFAEEHLGVDEESFEHSVFIRQMQCAIDNDGRKVLVEKLSNLTATGSEDLSLTRAVGGLEDALLEYVGTERSTTRPLDLVNARLDDLASRKKELIELNEKYLDIALKLREKKELVRKLNEELEKKKIFRGIIRLNILKSKKTEYEELHGKLEALRHKLDECSRKAEENRCFENISDSQISRASILLYDLKKTEEDLSALEESIKELREKISGLEINLDPEETFRQKTELIEAKLKEQEQVRQQTEEKSKRAHNKKKIAIPALMATIVFLTAFFATSSPVFAVLAVVSAIGAAVLLLTGSSKAETRQDNNAPDLSQTLKKCGFENLSQYIDYKEGQAKERSLLEHSRQKLSENAKNSENLRTKLEQIDAELGEIFRAAGLSHITDKDEALKILKDGRELLNNTKITQKELLTEINGIENNLRTILREAGTIIGEPSADYESLLRTINELEGKLSADDKIIHEEVSGNQDFLNGTTGLSGINRIEDEIKDLTDRINEANLETAALEVHLQQAPSEGELARVMEETEIFMARKNELEKMGSAMKLAIQVLKETALKMQRDFIPALNSEMGRIMGALTSDRYSKVSANDRLQLNLEVPETYELIPVNLLSGGTIDQVYFSMRLAAARLLEKGRETMPIFLDEPFAQYDENRTRKAFELLKEISEERQIFFFTCREREYELAKEIFGSEINRIRL